MDQLQPGDRVMLQCKNGSFAKYRPAVFVDIASSLAVFVLDTAGDKQQHGAFAVQRDGSLQDDEGRTITIERLGRMAVG